VILLIGLWLSGRANLLAERMLRRTPHIDPMLQSFFGSLARYLVLTVTVLAVLSEFGIRPILSAARACAKPAPSRDCAASTPPQSAAITRL
jgi:small-conductance mechanosensitive channel